MKTPLIVVTTLIVSAAIVANFEAGKWLLHFVQLLPGKDLTGHFVLYGALGAALAVFLKRSALPANVLVPAVAILIVVEEVSQLFFEHRTFSLLDLAASLTGFGLGLLAVQLWGGIQR